jgi:hypothetical protein
VTTCSILDHRRQRDTTRDRQLHHHHRYVALVAALVLLRAFDLVAHSLDQRADGLSAHPVVRVSTHCAVVLLLARAHARHQRARIRSKPTHTHAAHRAMYVEGSWSVPQNTSSHQNAMFCDQTGPRRLRRGGGWCGLCSGWVDNWSWCASPTLFTSCRIGVAELFRRHLPSVAPASLLLGLRPDGTVGLGRWDEAHLAWTQQRWGSRHARALLAQAAALAQVHPVGFFLVGLPFALLLVLRLSWQRLGTTPLAVLRPEGGRERERRVTCDAASTST